MGYQDLRGSSYTTASEGLWTPSIAGTTVRGNHSYTSERLGWWYRIGNYVHCHFCISCTKDPAISGDILIDTLPFKMINSIGYLAGATLSSYNGFLVPTNFDQLTLQTTRNTDFMYVLFSGRGGTLLANQSHLSSGMTLRGSISYQI